MRKKDSVPDSSVSILLIIPEGISHQQAARGFLQTHHQDSQAIFFNPAEETVKIETVRNMLRHSGFARAAREPQTLVLEAVDTATVPAQNALLKIVEEPPDNTTLLLTARPGHRLLPTLLSRCREIVWTEARPAPDENTSTDTAAAVKAIQEFLLNPKNASYAQLIDLAESLKESSAARSVLQRVIRDRSDAKPSVPARSLELLLSALDSLEKNGNVRLVLEHYFFAIKDQPSPRKE